ncbi:MAG: site-specific integrase [Candidatus Tectomicrobia bacterium]|nr:site-specific integrase [Candidatus Tectomicrobia bacterium]
MRSSELLTLRWGQVNLADRMIYLEEAKNGARRGVPTNDALFADLPEQGKVRHPFGDDVVARPESSDDQRVKPFAGVCKEMGVEDFHCHDLRHTYASHLVMAGGDLLRVKDFLAHKSLVMRARRRHLTPSPNLAAAQKLTSAYRAEEGSHLAQMWHKSAE